MPDRELLDQWITALESGAYKQATGQLRIHDWTLSQDSYKYCCLGVLCDLRANRGHGQWIDRAFQEEGDIRSGFLTEKTAEAMFGNSSNEQGAIESPSLSQFIFNNTGLARRNPSLADANDNGATFEQIAGFLREWRDSLDSGS